ncbi:MAG: hypothetical protein NTV44_01100 [Firmicutes bacterium]|nr:hypothetical protein [Bacillota bacterium]
MKYISFLDLSTNNILLITLVSVFVLFDIYYLVSHFLLTTRKFRRLTRDLERKYEYLHALLIGQDGQYIKRIEIVSRSNLLYVEIHDNFFKRFKEIRDNGDKQALLAISSLKDMLAAKKKKGFRDVYNKNKAFVLSYEQDVNNLNRDLIKVIKPEEDCRQASLAQKEELRRVKDDYRAHQSEIKLVEGSFERAFDGIEHIFQEILELLDNVLIGLPALCVMVQTIVPQKIDKLKVEYESLTKQSFPLHHLIVNGGIEEMKAELNNIINRLQQLDTTGVSGELNAMVDRVDNYLKAFDKEKEARDIFTNEYQGIYDSVNVLQQRFIRLSNNLPAVKKVYVVDDIYSNKVTEIQADVNAVGNVKRTLDTFIHSATKQPYSVLVKKMHELKDSSGKVASSMDEFQNYLKSLKTDSEEAFSLINTYFIRLKTAEKILRDMNVTAYSEKLAPRLDEAYGKLEIIDQALKVLPIDVKTINENVKSLKEEGQKLLEEVDAQYNLSVLAENAIVYSNRDRQHLSDIQKLVLQSEAMFYEGNFEKSYIETGNILKEIRRQTAETSRK